jgi:hypothetical protein
MTDETPNRAKVNALASIRRDRRFPSNVFSGQCADYLFFEPYLMFERGFIDVNNLLLREEKASVSALINLGNGDTTDEDGGVMFLEQDSKASDYLSKLKGDGSALNWMFLMDRYVCASDVGTWCIYCEKENDVAVFAVREGFPRAICLQVEGLLKAISIRQAGSPSDLGTFDFAKLVPHWRTALISEYVPSDDR